MSDLFKDLKVKVTGDMKAEEKKVERALFFVKGKMAFLLHEVGPVIEADIEGCCGRDSEAGPHSELPEEEGLWIWEGTPGWSDGRNWEGIDEGGDPIYEKRGVSRRPTMEELKFILGGPLRELWGPPQGFGETHCPQNCKGMDLGDGNFSGCSCWSGFLANGQPQPEDFKCDCPNHPVDG
jgi:hypothetical protein